MNITTEFSLGDTVFTVRDMRIVSFEIKGITIEACKEKQISVCYKDSGYNTYREIDCFKNRQQLLGHLTGEGE